jgi:hypothetical protein
MKTETEKLLEFKEKLLNFEKELEKLNSLMKRDNLKNKK